jgi:serine/threonine-protein kinase
LLQLLPGAVIGDRYKVVRRIKQGGMGAVYEVLDSQTNRRRGLKMLLPSVALDAVTRERFRREATVSGRVESDHIVEAIDAGTDPRTRADFLVMELLRGEDLGAELTRRGRIPADEVVAYLAQVASGLQKVHAEGIAHRDLKLENIFVTTRDDGSPLLKILDFGVAKVFETATGPLQTTQVVGTPLYMAPEQLTGDALIDHRADLYSLAHLAFAMLVGHAYWEPELRDSATIYRFMRLVMDGPSVSATARAAEYDVVLPLGFDPWFARAAAKDADDRHSSALAMVLGLAEALQVPAPPSLTRDARRQDRQEAQLSTTNPLAATAPLPGGDSTTGVVGPRARTTTQSKLWVGLAVAGAAVLLGGAALWRGVTSGPSAEKPAELGATVAAAADGRNAPTTTPPRLEPTSAAAAAVATSPHATSAASVPPASSSARRTPPLPPAPKKTVSRDEAAPKAQPTLKPQPAPAAATPKPKGGYDPLDEL